MAKYVDRVLMLRSLLWVLKQYQEKSTEEQDERPIRGWREGDEETLASTLAKLRATWADELEAYQEGRLSNKPDFHSIKETFLYKEMKEQSWSLETRNLYSSILSTYITFERRLTKERADELRELEAQFNMFLYPNRVTF